MPVQAPVPGYPYPGSNVAQGTDGLARLLTDTLGGGSGSNCVAVLIFGNAGMAQQLQQYFPGVQNGFGSAPAFGGPVQAFGGPAPAYGPGPAYSPGPANGYPAQPVPYPQVLAYQDTGSQPAVPSATIDVPALPPASWKTEREAEGDRRGVMGRFGAAMRELRGR
jgi:hypothetical protein